jgi:hypothetical protein
MSKHFYTLLVLLLTAFNLSAQPLARIHKNLATKLQAMPDDAKMKVIIMMADQVNLDALENTLAANRAQKAERASRESRTNARRDSPATRCAFANRIRFEL